MSAGGIDIVRYNPPVLRASNREREYRMQGNTSFAAPSNTSPANGDFQIARLPLHCQRPRAALAGTLTGASEGRGARNPWRLVPRPGRLGGAYADQRSSRQPVPSDQHGRLPSPPFASHSRAASPLGIDTLSQCSAG